MSEKIIPIPGRLRNVSSAGHVAGAVDIIDDDLNKLQSEINQETATTLSELDARVEALQEGTLIIVSELPTTGVAGKIYRVPGDGSYTDYMWDTSQQPAAFVEIATYTGNEGDFFNVNVYNSVPTTPYGNAALARGAVPDGMKKQGLQITYLLADGWFTDQYVGSAIDSTSWATASNWKSIGPVSVSQNISTGHTDINIGSNSYPVASVEEVSQLGQKLGEFQPIENPLSGCALSQYINSRGEAAGGGGYFYSRPFPISKGDSIKYVGVGDGCIAISLCDNVPTFPVTPVVHSINDGQTYTYEYTAESDGYYLISGLMSGFVSLSQRSGDSAFALIAQNAEDIAQNAEDIAQNAEDIAQLPIKIYDNVADNLIDINAIEENKYVKYDSGGIYSINNCSATGYIAVNEDDELSFINVFLSTTDARGLAWYNTQKNYLGGIQYNGIANDRKIIVPKGARYLRATISNANVSIARIIRITKAEQVNCADLLINTLCIGDSLTSGADYTTGTYLGNMRENYPYYLKKISHINVDYVSRPGWSAQDWWRDYSATDFSAFDSFVIWLGTNEGLTDTLDDDVIPYSDYNDFANTNTGCYCKIISKMIEQTPDARIFLVNCWASSGNLATTNSVIQKIAELYPNNVVGIIDMVNSGQWDESNRYLNHIINNIHFSRVGNLFLANYIYENIKRLIYSNLQKFNFLILNYGG